MPDNYDDWKQQHSLYERMQEHISVFHEVKLKHQSTFCVDMRRLDDVMEWFIATRELWLNNNIKDNQDE